MTEKKRIPVSAPVLAGNERAYVADCMETTWISSNGKYIALFERSFAEFCGVQHALSCCNGTTALHLALLAAGVGPGDEVLVPTLTFVATANTVVYCGAKPVFVDSEPATWNMDPAALESKITRRTKAIIPVHLYGHPADMDPIMAVARKHRLVVVEDAAEAHGAEYKGRRVGSIGDFGVFSFFGNKIVTTGEGGMVVTNNPDYAERVRMLKGQGMDPARRYWFPMIGYNYRMTNVAAAIGLGQMEKVQWHLQRRREVADCYMKRLKGVPAIEWQREQPWGKHVYWMFSVLLRGMGEAQRDMVMRRLAEQGVETRPVFFPMHVLPPYRESAAGGAFPVADGLAACGINLPSWAGLTTEDVHHVCDQLVKCLETTA